MGFSSLLVSLYSPLLFELKQYNIVSGKKILHCNFLPSTIYNILDIGSQNNYHQMVEVFSSHYCEMDPLRDVVEVE